MAHLSKNIEIDGVTVKPGEKKSGWLKVADIGALSVEMPYTAIHGIVEGPRLAVIAGIHGCEYTGIEASLRLSRDLDPQKIKGSLVIVHVVNVPAFQSRTPYVCPLDGLNLNKILPGKADGSISHQIVHKLFQEILFRSNGYIDLHAGDLHEALTVPFIIYEETPNEGANRKSRAMAEAFGVKYMWGVEGKGYSPGGSAGSSPPVPYIMVECGQEGRMEEEYIQIDYQGVLNVMDLWGMIEGKKTQEVAGKREIVRIKKGGKIESKAGGIFYSYVKPSDRVSEGDLLGEIKNIRGDVLEKIIAPADSMVLMYVSNPIVAPGDVLLGYAEL